VGCQVGASIPDIFTEPSNRGSQGRFTLRWRSAPVGQEFQPKTWLFQARDGMLEKM
jgi:hypothetical protein